MIMISVKKKEGLAAGEELLANLLLGQYNLQNKALKLIKRLSFKRGIPASPQSILVLRQGGLGDTVSALPIFFALRDKFPQAQIDLLTHNRTAGTTILEELLPRELFSKVYRYTAFPDKSLIPELRNNKYDLYLELPSYISSFYYELRSIYIAKAIRAKHAYGWYISSNFFFKKNQERLLQFLPDRIRLLNILIAAGIIKEDEHEKYIKQAAEYLKTAATSPVLIPPNSVAIMTGAGRSQNKWPIINFEEVAKYLISKGYSIIFIGNEKDAAEVAECMKDIPHTNLCGELTPLESAAVLSLCNFAVSNDTGPMHLAYNVGTPVIAIFSTRDYSNKWFPPTGENIVLRKNELPGKYNIQNIIPQEVIKAIETLQSRIRG